MVYNRGVLERGDHRQGKPLRPGKAKEGTRPGKPLERKLLTGREKLRKAQGRREYLDNCTVQDTPQLHAVQAIQAMTGVHPGYMPERRKERMANVLS